MSIEKPSINGLMAGGMADWKLNKAVEWSWLLYLGFICLSSIFLEAYRSFVFYEWLHFCFTMKDKSLISDTSIQCIVCPGCYLPKNTCDISIPVGFLMAQERISEEEIIGIVSFNFSFLFCAFRSVVHRCCHIFLTGSCWTHLYS